MIRRFFKRIYCTLRGHERKGFSVFTRKKGEKRWKCRLCGRKVNDYWF